MASASALALAAASEEEEEDMDDEDEGTSFDSGTVERARSRLSTLSMRSLANLVMAKSRADCTSRFVRSCRLRNSATERRYLSCLFHEKRGVVILAFVGLCFLCIQKFSWQVALQGLLATNL